MKARLCLKGNRLMYNFAEKYKIDHRKCGKLIVIPTIEDLPRLETLMQNGIINPLVIKATNITGNNNQSVFVSKNDASRIINENNNSNFLDDCKVVFVVD